MHLSFIEYRTIYPLSYVLDLGSIYISPFVFLGCVKQTLSEDLIVHQPHSTPSFPTHRPGWVRLASVCTGQLNFQLSIFRSAHRGKLVGFRLQPLAHCGLNPPSKWTLAGLSGRAGWLTRPCMTFSGFLDLIDVEWL